MIVADLLEYLEGLPQSAEVWLSVFPPHYIVRQNFPVEGLRQEGGVVFVDGMEEERESSP